MITVVVEGYTRNDYSRDIIVNVAEFNRDSEVGLYIIITRLLLGILFIRVVQLTLL